MKNFCARSLSFFFIWLFSCSSPSPDAGIRVRFAQDPESLHPLNYGNAQALQVLNLIYQSLLTVDLKDKSIQPLLATELPTVRRKDSLSYFTFTIRPEAKWDNGKPVTAADVAFSLKVLHSPVLDNERWRAQFDFIQDIQYKASLPNTFTLVCKGYTPEMKLMTGDFFVLPAHTFDTKGILTDISLVTIRQKFDSLAATPTFKNFATSFNSPKIARDTTWVRGSGPYKLTSWRTGQMVVVEKKKNWWGNQAASKSRVLEAQPSKISFQVIPDNAAAILALKAGQLDVLEDMPLVPFLEMQKDKQHKTNFNFFSSPSFDLVYVGINGNNPALQEKSTRLALAHLFNPPQFIKTLQGGYATPTVGFVHPEEKDFYNTSLAPVAFDPVKANQLLQKAGWQKNPEGWFKKTGNQNLKLQLEILLRSGNSDFENMAVLFKQNAEAIGIPVSIQSLESNQIVEKLQARRFDLFFRTLSGNPFSYNLIPLLHTASAAQGGSNVTNFGTPETDLLLEKIATEEENNQKGILLKSLQEKMQEESNWVFLYFLQNKTVISNRIDSVVVSPLKPGYDLLKFKVKK